MMGRFLVFVLPLVFSLCSATISGSPLTKARNDRVLFDDCDTQDRVSGYQLFTRKTLNDGECVQPTADSLKASTFDDKKKMIFFAHGYLAAGTHWYIHEMKNSILAKEDVNFVIIDWSKGSIDELPKAEKAAIVVAKELASFLNMLMSADQIKMSPKNIHIMGHSLGGIVVGKTGKELESKIGRITALDPDPFNYKGLALYTDVIHSSDNADGAVGDVDFWPNNMDFGNSTSWVEAHMYAIFLYTESVHRCDFTAHECPNWQDFKAGRCSTNPTSRMGHYAPQYPGRGNMYLRIEKEPPFC